MVSAKKFTRIIDITYVTLTLESTYLTYSSTSYCDQVIMRGARIIDYKLNTRLEI